MRAYVRVNAYVYVHRLMCTAAVRIRTLHSRTHMYTYVLLTIDVYIYIYRSSRRDLALRMHMRASACFAIGIVIDRDRLMHAHAYVHACMKINIYSNNKIFTCIRNINAHMHVLVISTRQNARLRRARTVQTIKCLELEARPSKPREGERGAKKIRPARLHLPV